MSVSLDVGLRKSIRKSVEEHSKFLHGIGRAQLDQGIKDVVMKVTKDYSDKMIQKTGVEPSLTDSDIKQYLEEVLTEVRKGKDQTNEK